MLACVKKRDFFTQVQQATQVTIIDDSAPIILGHRELLQKLKSNFLISSK
jgi:hypothetical protein